MGSSETARTDSFGDPIEHAFLWTAGKIVDLGVPVGGLATQAWGINEDREVILTAHMRCPNGSDDFWWSRAFVWQGGRMIDLGAVRSVITGWGLRNASSYVVAISDHGAVLGGSYAQGMSVPVIWPWSLIATSSVCPALPGRRHTAAVALADSGIVVGYAYSRLDENDSPVNARAFVWRAGTLSALPPLPGGGPGEALALNDRGRVVGWAITNRGRPHAVLWMPRHG